MALVPDPNCDGRGWIPVYSGVEADGLTPRMVAQRADPRCAGTGMVERPEILPGTWRRNLIDAGYDPDDPTAPKKDATIEQIGLKPVVVR